MKAKSPPAWLALPNSPHHNLPTPQLLHSLDSRYHQHTPHAAWIGRVLIICSRVLRASSSYEYYTAVRGQQQGLIIARDRTTFLPAVSHSTYQQHQHHPAPAPQHQHQHMGFLSQVFSSLLGIRRLCDVHITSSSSSSRERRVPAVDSSSSDKSF